nr:MAG TPA: hypothetical protein [Caudoviricetes sp.]
MTFCHLDNKTYKKYNIQVSESQDSSRKNLLYF